MFGSMRRGVGVPEERQQALRCGPCYVLLQGIPCSLTEPQLKSMAEGAGGLDFVNAYNPCDPGFAVFVFRTEPGVHMHTYSMLCNVLCVGCVVPFAALLLLITFCDLPVQMPCVRTTRSCATLKCTRTTWAGGACGWRCAHAAYACACPCSIFVLWMLNLWQHVL